MLQVRLLGEPGERLHVDDGDLGVLARLTQLLQQAVDGLEFLLDLQRLGRVHRLAPGEVVPGVKLLDLVLLAEGLDDAHEIAPEARARRRQVIQRLQIAQLLVADSALVQIRQFPRRVGLPGPLPEALAGVVQRCAGLIGLENAAPALLQHCDQRINAGAEAGDLRGVDLDRLGKLLGRQAPG